MSHIFGTLADISRSSDPGTATRKAGCAVITAAVSGTVQDDILHGDEKDLYVHVPPPMSAWRGNSIIPFGLCHHLVGDSEVAVLDAKSA